jgi:hypothetical protein
MTSNTFKNHLRRIVRRNSFLRTAAHTAVSDPVWFYFVLVGGFFILSMFLLLTILTKGVPVLIALLMVGSRHFFKKLYTVIYDDV